MLAEKLGISHKECDSMVAKMCCDILVGADEINGNLPHVVQAHAPSVKDINLAVALLNFRIHEFGSEFGLDAAYTNGTERIGV